MYINRNSIITSSADRQKDKLTFDDHYKDIVAITAVFTIFIAIFTNDLLLIILIVFQFLFTYSSLVSSSKGSQFIPPT